MSRAKHRDSNTQVSLFPFLAVLICTMGVLIVLLVLVVKQADSTAAASRDEIHQELDSELKQIAEAIEEADFVSESLGDFRPNLTESIREQTLRRAHYQEQQRRLEDQLRQLQHQAELLKTDSTSAPAETEIERLRQELAAAQQELAETRIAVAQRPSQYALVAYDGRNGTRRRPIYIECSPSGVDLQPFGIHLNLDEFARPILPGNPLDTAVLAIRDQWLKQDPRGAEGSPYPLILVRPGGSEAYSLVRDALKSWDSEFGHQIVPESINIAYPTEDPAFTAELYQIIADARVREARMLAALAMRGQGMGGAGQTVGYGNSLGAGGEAGGSGEGSSGSSPEFVLRASGRHGGFVSSGGSRGTAGSGTNTRPNSAESSSNNTSNSADPNNLSNNSESNNNNSNNNNNSSNPNSEGSASGNGGPRGPGGPATDGSAQTAPIAATRGSGWALPSRSPNAVAYRRPLRLSCQADRLLLLSEDRPGVVLKEFRFEPDVSAAVDPMVDHLWREIESWGVAGYGAYWKPELRIDIAPNAGPSYSQLKQLLDDSGLDIVELRP